MTDQVRWNGSCFLGQAMLSNRICRLQSALHEGNLSSGEHGMRDDHLRVTVGIADPSPGGVSVVLSTRNPFVRYAKIPKSDARSSR